MSRRAKDATQKQKRPNKHVKWIRKLDYANFRRFYFFIRSMLRSKQKKKLYTLAEVAPNYVIFNSSLRFLLTFFDLFFFSFRLEARKKRNRADRREIDFFVVTKMK